LIEAAAPALHTCCCGCFHVQVKTKSREVQLHKDSALGEAVLECYASGNRNVFSLGFVPVAGDNTVVLLARDTPASSPAVRDLGVDMSQVSFVCVWWGLGEDAWDCVGQGSWP
jgi:hypothetical protein